MFIVEVKRQGTWQPLNGYPATNYDIAIERLAEYSQEFPKEHYRLALVKL